MIPKEPWRPPYRRDAALVLAAALALALGAMWLVELFNRPAPRPSVLVTQPVVAATVLTERGAAALPRAVPDARLTLDDRARLGATPSLPRELTTDEALALLRSADADVRCAAALLLCGLSADEALAVRWNDVDAERGFVRVEGTQSRHVPLAAGTRPLLGTRAADGSTRLLHDAAGAALDVQVLATKLLVAAHDAGLERAHEVRPEALRHTYLAYVVRQGARLADVMRVAGMFEPGQLSAYSQLAPSGSKLDADAVQWTFPALREPLPGQTAA